MQHKTTYLVLLVLSMNAFLLSAKDNDSIIRKSVNVTREYQPVIGNVEKIFSKPNIVEPQVVKTVPNYSDITAPLNIDYHIQTLSPQEFLLTPQPIKKGLLRVGLGLPINSLLDLEYPVWSNTKNQLDISMHHLGIYGDKRHENVNGSINYNHLFRNFNLYAGLKGSYDFFNYYGKTYAGETSVRAADMLTNFGDAVYASSENQLFSLFQILSIPPDDSHWRMKATVGVKSLPAVKSIAYEVHAGFNLFNETRFKLSEKRINLNGMFEVPFNKNKLGLDVEIQNMLYDSPLLQNFQFPDNYSVVKLNPYYQLKGENWFARLGVKTGISIGHGRTFTPSPDVTAQWNVLPEYLSIYGGLTGDLTINTLDHSYNENRYINPNNRIDDTYTPMDAFIGFKTSPIYNLMIDAYGEYKIINNQYFYINRFYNLQTPSVNVMPANMNSLFINRFDVTYSKASQSTVGLRAVWDYRGFLHVFAKGAYHHWNVENAVHAWQLPRWEANFGGDVKIGNDLQLNTQFIFQNGRYSLLSDPNGTKMSSIADWNVGANYLYRQDLSFFIQLNNLLNKKYAFYQGYDVQGINFRLGAAFGF